MSITEEESNKRKNKALFAMGVTVGGTATAFAPKIYIAAKWIFSIIF